MGANAGNVAQASRRIGIYYWNDALCAYALFLVIEVDNMTYTYLSFFTIPIGMLPEHRIGPYGLLSVVGPTLNAALDLRFFLELDGKLR